MRNREYLLKVKEPEVIIENFVAYLGDEQVIVSI